MALYELGRVVTWSLLLGGDTGALDRVGPSGEIAADKRAELLGRAGDGFQTLARKRLPHFGRIPDGAVSLMTSLGLAAFVGLTGIHAGPIFLSALREAGIGLLLGGMVVTLLPQLVGFCFGHFVLRMNPILLLGALTGAQTVTAAMAALQERSGSSVVVLGYTPAYPISNILLTTWGSVMVAVFAR